MKQWSIILLSLMNLDVASQGNDNLVKIDTHKVYVKAGKEVIVRIKVDVKSGFHIQAHEVTDELIVPTTVEIVSNKDLIVGKQFFPPTKKFMLTGTDQYLDVYDGEFEIQISLNVSKTIQKGIHQLKGKLTYQACDSTRCLFPRKMDFSISLDAQ